MTNIQQSASFKREAKKREEQKLPKEYIPFGTEWAKEMKKLPKEIIISFFAASQIKNNRLKEVCKKTILYAPQILPQVEICHFELAYEIIEEMREAIK